MAIVKNDKVLILGASGWIGHYVSQSLQKKNIGTDIVGTYYSNESISSISGRLQPFDYRKADDLLDFIEAFRPDVVINLLSGKDTALLQFHTVLLRTIKTYNPWYLYMSSSMVFDANLAVPHQEDDATNAKSDYGKLKEKCEQQIKKNLTNYCICRISAIHGFAPHKISRTENFLQQLQRGGNIKVDKHVFQNRLEVSDLADILTELIYKQPHGVFHVGTVDQTEEDIFLRKIASVFGYSPDGVISMPSQPKYLTVVPEKIFKIVGEQYMKTETNTIEKIAAIPEFKKYQA